jgi:alkyl hydroperoxide reductase subunit AhpC
MAKNFKKGFDSLLGNGDGNTNVSNSANSVTKKDGAVETRVTFIIDPDLLSKFHKLHQVESYKRTIESGQIVKTLIKDTFKDALEEYIKNYEKKNGKLI